MRPLYTALLVSGDTHLPLMPSTSYLDCSDSALLTLVARRDRDALGELFRRYGTVMLIALGWAEHDLVGAEEATVAVFLDLWQRPEAYMPGADSTRSHLLRVALADATEDSLGSAVARLAQLEGWTYHDVAESLARPSRHVASLIREQLHRLHDETP